MLPNHICTSLQIGTSITETQPFPLANHFQFLSQQVGDKEIAHEESDIAMNLCML